MASEAIKAAQAANVSALILRVALADLSKADASERQADAAALLATKAIAFLACEKIGRLWNKGDEKITAKGAWRDVWTLTLKQWAFNGNAIFRDTEHFADQMRATKDKARKVEMVNSYLADHKGAEVVTALAKVRKAGRSIVQHAADNHGATLKAIAAMESPEAQLAAFGEFMGATYGATYAAVIRFFAEDKSSSGEKADPVETMIAKLGKMDDVAALERIAATIAERLGEIARVKAALETVSDDDGLAEAEAEARAMLTGETVEMAEAA